MRLSDETAPEGPPRGAPEEASAGATQWELIRDPAHVIKRYAPVIRRYFGLLIRNPDDAEEATQEFFLRIVESGFSRATRGAASTASPACRRRTSTKAPRPARSASGWPAGGAAS